MTENINSYTFITAIALTTLAGLATVAGAAAAVVSRDNNKSALAWALGISAGVMIFISFMEILPESISELCHIFDEITGKILGFTTFFAGAGLVALIDRMLQNHDHTRCPHASDIRTDNTSTDKAGMRRQGIVLAIAISIHNFPEGIATFISSLNGLNIAMPIVLAIAIHNLPIGMAIAVPIYQSTGSRSKALLAAMLSGLAEPLGALAGGLILLPFWSDTVCALMLSAVAGVMVYISFDELLPGAFRYGRHHAVVGGVMAGFLLMAFSLELFH